MAWATADHAVRGAYRPAGGKLGTPILLAPRRPFAPPSYDEPSLVMEGSGRATAAWEESDAVTVRTITRDFDATGVEPAVVVDSVPSFVREGPPEACRPPGAIVVLSSRNATVFTFDDLYPGYRACLLARGTPVRMTLSPEEYPQDVSAWSLAGPFAAYATGYQGHSADFSTMRVLDLRDPDSGANRSVKLGDGLNSPVVLATSRLKPNGAVAWIHCDPDCDGRRPKRVFAWNIHSARPRLLDSGRRIDHRSLKLRGSRLTWRKRGKLRSARLR